MYPLHTLTTVLWRLYSLSKEALTFHTTFNFMKRELDSSSRIKLPYTKELLLPRYKSSQDILCSVPKKGQVYGDRIKGHNLQKRQPTWCQFKMLNEIPGAKARVKGKVGFELLRQTTFHSNKRCQHLPEESR
jgi:hypothetical protein